MEEAAIKLYGDPVDEGALAQIRTCAADPRTAGAALMADHHKGYSMPIGGVIAYRDAVSPSGAGYDIACGNQAVRLDAPLAEVRANLESILDDIYYTLEFGVGKANAERVDDPLFDEHRRTIAHRILSTVLMHVGKPYSNPVLAQYHEGEYNKLALDSSSEAGPVKSTPLRTRLMPF